MSEAHVVVIGGGIAGTAAALEAARHTPNVTLVAGAPGATHLGPGALDHVPWERSTGGHAEHEPAVAHLIEELGGYVLGSTPSIIATSAGILRPATGRDRALLDVAALGDGIVMIPRCGRRGWDADALARSLSASQLASERALRFEAFDSGILRYADEKSAPDATIAARHDDASRLGWLGQRLTHSLQNTSGVRAILLPPWLGAALERATELSRVVRLPCGEVAVGLAGPCGFRFAAGRDAALARRNVTTRAGFVREVHPHRQDVAVLLESGEMLRAGAVVIATGGLIGGGLVYSPSDAISGGEVPDAARPFLKSALVRMPVGVRGQAFDAPGSLFGVAPETLAWPFTDDGALERAGVLVDDTGAVKNHARVFACGELVADRPRTWLAAAASGIAAGRAAAQLQPGVANP